MDLRKGCTVKLIFEVTGFGIIGKALIPGLWACINYLEMLGIAYGLV